MLRSLLRASRSLSSVCPANCINSSSVVRPLTRVMPSTPSIGRDTSHCRYLSSTPLLKPSRIEFVYPKDSIESVLSEIELPEDTLKTCPWLAHASPEAIRTRFKKIEAILEKNEIGREHLGDEFLIPLLVLRWDGKYGTERRLHTFVRYGDNYLTNLKDFNERLAYFNQALNISDKDAVEMAEKYGFLFLIPLEDIEERLNLLLEYGEMAPQEICLNLRVLSMSHDELKKRIKKMKAASVNVTLYGLLRSRIDFERSLIMNRGQVYQDRGLRNVEFLQKTLDCSSSELENMLRNEETLIIADIEELSKTIELLRRSGLHNADIVRNPRLFRFTSSVLEERIKKLKLVNGLISAKNLSETDENFEQIVKRLEHSIKHKQRIN